MSAPNNGPDPSTWKQPSMFLKGNFAPVVAEHDRQAAEVVSGEVPRCLYGAAYARNGPNPHFEPPGQHHWFDGDGMIHAIYFEEDGSVSYANKYVRTESWLEENKRGAAYYLGIADLGTVYGLANLVLDGVRGFFGAPKAFNKVASNTSLIYHDKRLLALVENGVPHHVAASTLESFGAFDYDGKLTHPFTAHPKVDPLTGEMLSFGYTFDKSPGCEYFLVSADGQKRASVPITLHNNRNIMMHDMAFSRQYAILLDFPYLYRLSNVMNGKSPLGMANDEPARIGLLPRGASDASELRWFDVESPCFAFHVANSWEDGDNVHVLACRTAKLSMERLSDKRDEKKKQKKGAVLYEWVLNTADGSVKERTLVDVFGEFPVCDEQNRWGCKTRYVWYAGQGGGHFNKLMKVDLFNDNHITVFQLPEGHVNDEFVFVNTNKVQYKGDHDPSRDAESPDDGGVLLGFCYDSTRNASYLLILDAATMTEKAKVALPARVAHGFHGKFITKQQIASEVRGDKPL